MHLDHPAILAIIWIVAIGFNNTPVGLIATLYTLSELGILPK